MTLRKISDAIRTVEAIWSEKIYTELVGLWGLVEL